jgi:hypothetical protein
MLLGVQHIPLYNIKLKTRRSVVKLAIPSVQRSCNGNRRMLKLHIFYYFHFFKTQHLGYLAL